MTTFAPALSVVVPCFNERGNIGRFAAELLPPLRALGLPFEVVAVDDGSTDGTKAALAELERAGLLALVDQSHRGLGAALRAGFARARGEFIATLDADLTFAPADIAKLLRRQREIGADLVAGSPFLASNDLAEVPWRRRLPSLLLNAFYRGLLRPGFTSYTPILRLYRAAVLKRLTLRSEGFEINAEIAAGFIRAGKIVADTPAPLRLRRHGGSKMAAWPELARHARLIARLIWRISMLA